MNKHAKHLGQKSFSSKVIVGDTDTQTHTHTHTHNTGLIALPRPLGKCLAVFTVFVYVAAFW